MTGDELRDQVVLESAVRSLKAYKEYRVLDMQTKMFGISVRGLVLDYATALENGLDRQALVFSLLSDVQELLDRRQLRAANQLVNRAKWYLGRGAQLLLDSGKYLELL